ncbi:hypothetical protein SEUCBS140593_002727 [Sporothrix eucalyptigena]|uniref:Uncharacterized protein n=1 Tax=Sporothrix eucalyptigena TaxID=1812306 RepID=A0ABP0B8W2_9PEZI
MYYSKKAFLAAATAGFGGLVSLVSADNSLQTSDSGLVSRDTTFKNGTTFNKSFNGATLFSGELSGGPATVDISLVCKDCYITGQVTTELDIIPRSSSNSTANSNVTTTETTNLTSVAHTFFSDVANITETVIDDVTEALKNDTEALLETPTLTTLKAFLHNLTRPTLDVDFAIVDAAAEVVGLPEYRFSMTLDAFEVYVQTQLSISGSLTTTVNLFTSETDYGIRYGNDLELGVVLTVDLILNADLGGDNNADGGDGIEIDSGFHLQMNDGLALNIDLFGNNVSDIVFNGGTFEFLPVTVSASKLTLNAVVRVGVHAGIILASDDFKFDGIDLATYSAGVETVTFADVANLTLSIAAAGNNGSLASAEVDDISSCASGTSADLVVEEIFGFDIGADAGASVQIGDFLSWGVGPSTMLPVFYTTVAQCAGSVASAATATATATATTKATGAARRAVSTTASAAMASTTAVLSTTVVYTATACLSAGLLNCPASLQTTAVTTTTTTTTLTVPSGSAATWPATTATTAIAKLATFGSNAKAIGLTASGTPSSYVPTTSSTLSSIAPSSTGITVAGHHLSSKEEHIAIGVGVGVGVPLVAGVAATVM